MGDSLKAEKFSRHSHLRRGQRDYQGRREASPRQQDGFDERTRYHDRKAPDRFHSRKGGAQATEQHFYSRKESQRDDRAYAVIKSATRMRRNGPALLSANELKTKIRDTKRLLSYAESLPADARIEKERALAGYQKDLEIVEARRRRAAMIKRYHFVRFLERKSATRELNKLLRQAHDLRESSCPTKVAELEDLESKIRIARINLNYTIYSPLTEKYISLYPNHRRDQPPETEDSNLIRNNSGEKPPLWYAVKRSMEDNTLELLRDGKLRVGLSGEKIQNGGRNCDLPPSTIDAMTLPVLGSSQKPQQQQKQSDSKDVMETKKQLQPNQKRLRNNSTQPHHHMDTDVQTGIDDDSDGGFFEE